MGWLQTATVIVHVLLAAAIVALVLIQRGRGADAGAGFGSGASGTVFGARGSASFLSRMTATMAALFFVTSLALSYLGGRQTATPSSVLDRAPEQKVEQTLPVQPSTQTPPPAAPAPAAPVPESAAGGAAGGTSPAAPPASPSAGTGAAPQPAQPPG